MSFEKKCCFFHNYENNRRNSVITNSLTKEKIHYLNNRLRFVGGAMD